MPGDRCIDLELEEGHMADETDTDIETYSEENAVDITIVVTGNAHVIINGDPITEDVDSPNKLHISMKHEGDILITVNGEDFQIEDA